MEKCISRFVYFTFASACNLSNAMCTLYGVSADWIHRRSFANGYTLALADTLCTIFALLAGRIACEWVLHCECDEKHLWKIFYFYCVYDRYEMRA